MTSKVILILLMMLVDVSISGDQQIDGKKIESKVLSRRKRFVVFPVGSSFSVAVCMTVGVYGNPQFSLFSWALNYGFAYNLPSNASYVLNYPLDIISFPVLGPAVERPQYHKITWPPSTTTPAPAPDMMDYHDHDHDHDHDDHTVPPTGDDPHGDGSRRRKFHVYYQPQYETKPMIQRRFRRDIYRNIESVIDKMGYHGRDCILQALCESPQVFNMKQRTMVQELIKTVFSFPKSKVLPFEHPELLIYDEAHRKGRSKINCDRSYSKCGFSLIKMALGKYSKPQNSFT